MPVFKAKKIANYIIRFSQYHGDPISNLKLQKLLYYAQAWHLALYDKPLFEEEIEAWVHGPAVRSVYRSYKDWSWKPITTEPAMPDLTKHAKEHLDEVMDVYGGLSAFDLEKLTHSEPPWRNARKGIPPDEPSSRVISRGDMKAFYRKMLDVKK